MKARGAILLFALATLAAVALTDWSPDWRILPALLIGWFLADMASGVVHMLMDYLPCPEGVGLERLYFYDGPRDGADYQALRRAVMRPIGPIGRLLFDFKVHHPRPDALGRRTLYEQVWSTILFGTLPLALILAAAAALWPVPGWAMAAALSLMLGGAFSQYFHGTLHRADNPWPVRAMRRAGLLMTPARHARHHESLQRDFATINGWSNPLLNIVFRRLRAGGRLDDHGLVPN